MLQSTQLWKFSWPRWWRHWKCLTKKTSGHTSNKKPGCKISRMSSSHVIMYLTHLSHLLFNLPLCHNCSSNSEARYHHQWHAVYIRSHIRLKVDGNSRKYSWLQTFGSGSSETIWYLISNTITSCNTYFYETRLEKFYTRHAMRIVQASSSSSSPVALSLTMRSILNTQLHPDKELLTPDQN